MRRCRETASRVVDVDSPIWSLALGLVVAVGLAACSASGSEGEGESGGSTSSSFEVADEGLASASVEAGLDEAETGGATSAERIGAELWEQADNTLFLPDQPSSTFRSVLGPSASGQPWLVAGDVFDAATATGDPTVWQSLDPNRDDWRATTLDLPIGATTGWVSDLGRLGEVSVAIGGHEGAGIRRASAWIDDGTGWSAVASEELEEPLWLSHVAVDQEGGRLAILGRGTDDRGQGRPQIWLSSDGSTFTPTTHPEVAADETLHAIAVGRPGIVAAGRIRFGDEWAAAAWFSHDGSDWERIRLPAPGSARSIVNSVTWFEDRFVAVGAAASDRAWEPVSWWSDDGVIWSSEGGSFEADTGGFISSAGSSAERVVGLGDRLLATDDSGAVQQVWQSTDGSGWSIVSDLRPTQPQGVEITDVAEADGVVVAVADEPSLLVLDDGWQRVVVDLDQAPSPSATPDIDRLMAVGDRFIAVGGAWDRSDRLEARIWSSVDGREWEELGKVVSADAGPVSGVARRGDDLVAVGSENLGSPGASRPAQGLLWTLQGSRWNLRSAGAMESDTARTLFTGVASIGQEAVIVGYRFGAGDDGVEPLLFESDGVRWVETTTGLGGSGNQELVAVCGTQSGAAVVAARASDGGRTDVALVARSSGGGWQRAIVPSAPPSVGFRRVVACAHDGEGFLVAGWTVTNGVDDVLLWSSPDGREWTEVVDLPERNEVADRWSSGVAGVDGGFLVVGRDQSSGTERVLLLVRSSNGWSQLHLPEESDGMTDLSIAELGGTVVVQGWDDGAERLFVADLEALLGQALSSG